MVVHDVAPIYYPFSFKWMERFVNLADYVAQWSKDPSTKCGAVLVDDRKRVISMGFNGLPDRIADTPEILHNREQKYKFTIHAEVNSILHCPAPTQGLHMFVMAPTCDNCAKHIVAAGIATVTWREPTEDLVSRWQSSIDTALEIYKSAGVSVYEVRNNGSIKILTDSRIRG